MTINVLFKIPQETLKVKSMRLDMETILIDNYVTKTLKVDL